LQAVVSGQLRIGDLTSWRRSRGLVQIPTEGPRHFEGPCGTTHYNPESPGFDRQGFPRDSYAHPTTACAFMAIVQDWKKNHCRPADAGCRVFWGDISHPTTTSYNGHSTGGHGHGNCIDIRPMRKGAAANAPLYYSSRDYDRDMTRKFIELAKSKGADTVLFNDPQIATGRAGGHDNHMHLCIKPGPKSNETCRKFKYDPNVCEKGS
jgi:hypothetical protein